jgi:hypothetical protein
MRSARRRSLRIRRRGRAGLFLLNDRKRMIVAVYLRKAGVRGSGFRPREDP